MRTITATTTPLPQDSEGESERGRRDYSLVPRVSCWAVDKTLSGLMTSLKHSSVVFTVIYVLYFYFKRDKCSICVSFDSEP